MVKGDLGWAKLRVDRHGRALSYAGRLRTMENFRWPKQVVEALGEKGGIGSWVDFVKSLRERYGLGEEWHEEGWRERNWKQLVRKTVLEVAGRDWRAELLKRVDLGDYASQQQQLVRAEYLKDFRKGNDLTEKIVKRCEWGCHWQPVNME